MIMTIFVTAWSSRASIINIPADYPSIQQGVEAAIDGDTVLVQPGIYVENVILSGFNITLASLFLTTGDVGYIEETVIDGDSAGTVVWIANHEDSTMLVSGFTITNGFGGAGGIEIVNSGPKISHNIIMENHSTWCGGGIECFQANPVISNNLIKENTAVFGGAGIYCYNSAPMISYNDINNNTATDYLGLGGGIRCWISHVSLNNNIIHHNTTLGMGGGISCGASNPVLINNLFYGNVAGGGGGVYCSWANPEITNCILWNNSPSEMLTDPSSNPKITYSDIAGGWPGTGNFDIDPQFRDPVNNDFHLRTVACGDDDNSRCVDAGDPLIVDGLLDCDWGQGGPRSDMGAYGGADSVMTAVFDNSPLLPEQFTTLQNYPNPFNSETIIEFYLRSESEIRLSIYNILGQEIKTLHVGQVRSGKNSIIWNADRYPSGVYFARLKSPEITKNLKMILLK
jgi:hypothetical protein